MKCKYCNSENLILKQNSFETDDILKANQVAVRCADCGKFIKWCSKDDRPQYYANTKKHWESQQSKEIKNEPTTKEQLFEAESQITKGKELDPKTKFVKKQDVLDLIDRTIKQSANILSSYQVRSVEARAMLNGIRDSIERL